MIVIQIQIKNESKKRKSRKKVMEWLQKWCVGFSFKKRRKEIYDDSGGGSIGFGDESGGYREGKGRRKVE